MRSAKWHAAQLPRRRHAARAPRSRADLGVAQLLAQPAARVEATAGRRRRRARHVALEHEAPRSAGADRGRARPTGAPRCTGAAGPRRAARRAQLHQLAQVHHAHAVADVLDHRQVVGDEQVGQAELAAQVQQQVEDLGLDRHVERRHRLVADHELGIQGECARDADALTLAAARTRGDSAARSRAAVPRSRGSRRRARRGSCGRPSRSPCRPGRAGPRR